MQYDPDDTIAAIGTASGGAPRGMVRLSGPQVLSCLEKCFRPSNTGVSLSEVQTSQMLSGSISLPDSRQAALNCDLFYWPGTRSYTRQPTAELHTIGSPPLLQYLLSTVCQAGARLAEPGEFTLRAFLAGRLDLMQAEAVLGVINAQSNRELHTALAQLAGGLSGPLTALREQLLQLLAELEAGLDFVDEDIEFITAAQLHEQLTAAQATVDSILAQLACREEVSELPRVVLVGAPNAGKSSLFNSLIERLAIAGSDNQALVSERSGTTRDFITAALEMDGLAFELVDTAGLHTVSDAAAVDHLVQQATDQQQQLADLLIRCEVADARFLLPKQTNEIIARTKCDLLDASTSCDGRQIICSSLDGTGLEQLAQSVFDKLSEQLRETNRSCTHTAARCLNSLRHAQESLQHAVQLVATAGGEELIAAEVRGALHAIGQVVGTVYTDDILDRIFGQFCIGK